MLQELQIPMLKVSAPELVSGVSGESEQKLRELFDLAVVSTSLFMDQHQYFKSTVMYSNNKTGDPLLAFTFFFLCSPPVHAFCS